MEEQFIRAYRKTATVIKAFKELLGRKKINFPSMKKNEDLVIICNGPSVKNCEEKIRSHGDVDYMCVNFFPSTSELFETLQPRFICMVDAGFYNGTNKAEDIKKLKAKLENVEWQMFFIQMKNQNLNIQNEKIVRIPLSTNIYSDKITGTIDWLFKKNLATVPYWTVANTALFVATLMKYENVYIYGIDMSMFKNFYIDDNNHLVTIEKHYYGEKKMDYSAEYQSVMEGGIEHMFDSQLQAFHSFNMIRDFAKRNQVKIFNCTPGSYVDSFERI